LADAVGALLADAALRERIGEAGYRTVAERYSIDAQVHRIEAVYDEELARAGVLLPAAGRASGGRRTVTAGAPSSERGALEVPPV
jgi:hypothetical protein